MVFPHIRLLWFKFSILSWIFLSTLFYYLPLLKRYEFNFINSTVFFIIKLNEVFNSKKKENTLIRCFL